MRALRGSRLRRGFPRRRPRATSSNGLPLEEPGRCRTTGSSGTQPALQVAAEHSDARAEHGAGLRGRRRPLRSAIAIARCAGVRSSPACPRRTPSDRRGQSRHRSPPAPRAAAGRARAPIIRGGRASASGAAAVPMCGKPSAIERGPRRHTSAAAAMSFIEGTFLSSE